MLLAGISAARARVTAKDIATGVLLHLPQIRLTRKQVGLVGDSILRPECVRRGHESAGTAVASGEAPGRYKILSVKTF